MHTPSYSTQPRETLDFDLVVAGGGLPGLCAAVSAARHGARVALVQERPVLGGNCSSEVRVVPHGAVHSNAWAAETGLPHAIVLEDRSRNHEHYFDHGMIDTPFDLLLLEVARREPLLSLFLNTTIRGVESEPLDAEPLPQARPTLNGLGRLGGPRRRITALHAAQMGSEREFLFTARQFIDATGDGTVGYLAGADFRYGREARHEFNEPLAPVESDDVTMGATLAMRVRDTGRPAAFHAPAWAAPYRTAADIGPGRGCYHIGEPVFGGYWWIEVCNPFHQIRDNAEIRHELHRHVLGVWDYLKNYADCKERLTRHALDWIGMIPGKRESRRLVGDVTVTESDCHADAAWPDAIAPAGWWIDLHIKGGVLNKVDPGERENEDANYKHWIRVAPFGVPLRAFYSRNVENLWMAGRCLSTTHVALGPVRVMQTLAMLAQGVGLAAAYALEHGITPREAARPGGPHIGNIQQALLRDDVRIPGLRNSDPSDLARTAKATATSEAALDLSRLGDAPRWESFGNRPDMPPALAVVVPLTAPRLETAAFYLRNTSGEARELSAELQPMERIWDRPDREPIARAAVRVPAHSEGWCEATFAANVTPGRPYRIVLRGAEGVAWAACADFPAGTVTQYFHACEGGPEPKNACLPGFQPSEVEIPAYRHWRQRKQALALRLDPAPRPYAAANTVDGCAWVEDLPHLWASDPAQALPQALDLDFGGTAEFDSVEIAFDTNLNRPIQSEVPFYRPPECARDWRLLARSGGEWREVYHESGNFQRRRKARFDPVRADALRLEIMATNGLQEGRVYEIRVYRTFTP